MQQNASTSRLLRLPPEIRLRIYGFVFGGYQVWIGDKLDTTGGVRTMQTYRKRIGDGQHYGKKFHHYTGGSRWDRGLDLRVLRVCRQVFTEAALLPYALNTFTFEKGNVRDLFEETAREGKKVVQRKATGEYEIMEFGQFFERHKVEEVAEPYVYKTLKKYKKYKREEMIVTRNRNKAGERVVHKPFKKNKREEMIVTRSRSKAG